MIRQVQPGDPDAEQLLFIARHTPCLGARAEVDLLMQHRNGALPYRFYLAGENTLLQLGPRGAVLCGRPQDRKETELFLQFEKINRLTSTGWTPTGWHKTRFMLMARTPLEEDAPGFTRPTGFDPAPPVEPVLQVLESSDGRIVPEHVREAFYAEICLRRNHGRALVYGVWEGDELVCTAGAYAITEAEGYIACVETRPAARGKGYASGLLRALDATLPGHTLTLMCERHMRPYYVRLGYRPISGETVLATRHG